MNLESFKLIHLIGIFALFIAFGAVLAESGQNGVKKRWTSLLHGIALLVILVAGFGMLSALGIHGNPPAWVSGKLAIWFLLGLCLIPARRRLLPRSLMILILILLGGAAASLAIWKP